ncbi:RepB family plasmid replication initiator protein [Rosenbergiella collisarenosi]|nr:RepB family plasmid replication initiator protein [Rosenbergiella collisarenosi]
MGIIIQPHRRIMRSKSPRIIQSNELTEAAYHLPLQAKRMLWLCLRQIFQKSETDPLEPTYIVKVSDYAAIFQVSLSTASKDLKSAIETISNSSVVFYPANGECEEIRRPWLAEVGLKRGRGAWSIEFNSKIMPYITGLSSKFTTYNLYDCGKLKSVRVIRLYECLCQYRSTGQFIVSPEWLAERFHLPESQRINRAEMKRTFIEPSIVSINKNTVLTVVYSENTNSDFVFTFAEKESGKAKITG